MKYLYHTVAGASAWGSLRSFKRARNGVKCIRKEWPNAEVERVLILSNGAQRYWRWRSNKWSTAFYKEPNKDDLSRW